MGNLSKVWLLIFGYALLFLAPSGKSGSLLGSPRSKQAQPPDLSQTLQNTINQFAVAMDYDLGATCGGKMKIEGFSLNADPSRLARSLRDNLPRNEFGGSSGVFMAVTIGGRAGFLVLGGQGTACGQPAKNARANGVGGADVSFGGGSDDLNLIIIAGNGGNGTSGARGVATFGDPNANAGNGGAGGQAKASWGLRGCICAVAGNGGLGGIRGIYSKEAVLPEFDKKARAGLAGAGGDGGDVNLSWTSCSAVGARAGKGGLANDAIEPQRKLRKSTEILPDPSAPEFPHEQRGGDGGPVSLSSPQTPNFDLTGTSPGATGGSGGNVNARDPFVEKQPLGRPGNGGSVTRTGTGAQAISAAGGSGGVVELVEKKTGAQGTPGKVTDN